MAVFASMSDYKAGRAPVEETPPTRVRRPPNSVKDAAYRRQGGVCFYCAKRLRRPFVLDHLMPKSRGGGNGSINRVAACRPCDAKKRDRLPTLFEMERQRALVGGGENGA